MTSRSRRRAPWLVPLTALAVLTGAGAAGWNLWDGMGVGRCEFAAAGREEAFSADQSGNAATIAGLTVKRGMPARAATIALATAIQESKLRNITYGDRDSLGLFQQRPSQGWGSEEQILDPVHSTNAFLDALEKVDGWQTGEVTEVAQAVQKSGYPTAYADHEWEGRVLAAALTGEEGATMGCRLPDVDDGSAASAEAVRTALRREVGVDVAADGKTLTVTTADARTARAVGAWAVARAGDLAITEVTVADREWRRARGRRALQWHEAGTPSGADTVVIAVG